MAFLSENRYEDVSMEHDTVVKLISCIIHLRNGISDLTAENSHAKIFAFLSKKCGRDIYLEQEITVKQGAFLALLS